MENTQNIGDYLAILRRRRTLLLGVFFSVLAIGLLVAVLLPARYTSTATILVERQEIPEEYVRSTITTYADQRIQVISQQVMTTGNLSRIIQEFNLYSSLTDRQPISSVADRMRDDISLDPVVAEVVDPRSGRPSSATIAFQLSYTSESPVLAQRVANELVTLFLNESVRQRTAQAQEATSFLADEAGRLREQILDLEEQLATFKQDNLDNLPELSQLNMQLMERTERELGEVERQLGSLEERRIYLESELAQLAPSSTLYGADGARILSPADRLKSLEAQFVGLQAVYSADHPDLVKMRKEIEALRKQVATTNTRADLALQLRQQRAELGQLQERYAPAHPDVRSLERQVAETEQQLNALPLQEGEQPALETRPDNPAYIQLQAQLKATDTELKSLAESRAALQRKLESLEQRIVQAPQVEREYRSLTRDHENAVAKYQEVRAKQMEAQLSQSLEQERKGERFELIEPPLLPQVPSAPNRPAIAFLAFVLASAGAVGTVAVRESVDDGVYSVGDLSAAVGAMPIAVIPYIDTDEEHTRSRRRIWLLVAGAVAAVVIALVCVQVFVRPLDVLWFALMRRLGL